MIISNDNKLKIYISKLYYDVYVIDKYTDSKIIY